MKISSDIERLRSAERDAGSILEDAGAEARKVRGEAENRIVELNSETDAEIAAVRVRMQAEQEQAVAAIVADSSSMLTVGCEAVAAKLAEGKRDAVTLVVEALKTL